MRYDVQIKLLCPVINFTLFLLRSWNFLSFSRDFPHLTKRGISLNVYNGSPQIRTLGHIKLTYVNWG